jgi:hypothetical protein
VLDVPTELITTTSISDLDLALAAGGFEGRGSIDGSGCGAPTAGELRIQAMVNNWGGITDRADGAVYTSGGAMFYDSDANGYYDYLEVASDTGRFIYDPVTDTWIWRSNNDRDAD